MTGQVAALVAPRWWEPFSPAHPKSTRAGWPWSMEWHSTLRLLIKWISTLRQTWDITIGPWRWGAGEWPAVQLSGNSSDKRLLSQRVVTCVTGKNKISRIILSVWTWKDYLFLPTIEPRKCFAKEGMFGVLFPNKFFFILAEGNFCPLAIDRLLQ